MSIQLFLTYIKSNRALALERTRFELHLLFQVVKVSSVKRDFQLIVIRSWNRAFYADLSLLQRDLVESKDNDFLKIT